MIRDTYKFENGEYDLIVIGGGINGAAVANLASFQGLKVALLEKNDFASGTSSKSTKLIHGGLRYLENFHFSLVREALRERAVQIKKAPHLVKPLEFVVPVYKFNKRPFWKYRLGVALYDMLSGRYRIGRRKFLTARKIVGAIPDIIQKDLHGGVSYFDAQMDDARLCLENVLQADKQGAHVANYIEVKDIIKENGQAIGVRAYDSIDKRYCTLKAKHIVSAVGPWTNDFLRKERNQGPGKIRPTKGVHIVYQGHFSDKALLLGNEKDGRIFFIIPWGKNSLIGTTDTDYKGDVNKVEVEDEDIAYLLDAVKKYFPDHNVERENIIETFAGLRPLVRAEGNASKVTREHVIEQSFSGIYYILGGKYTTYRQIAEDCLKEIYGTRFIFDQNDFSVFGGKPVSEPVDAVSRKFEMPQDVVELLMAVYGSQYGNVLRLTHREQDLKKRLETNTDIIRAQIVYAIQVEMAQSPEDIYYRRLGLRYMVKDADRMIREIKSIKGVRA